MPLKIRHSQASRQDLQDIWPYIARDNPPAEDRLLRRIAQKISLIADKPEIGRRRPDLGDFRSLPIGNYLVLYAIDADTLNIVRVISGYRDITPDQLSD